MSPHHLQLSQVGPSRDADVPSFGLRPAGRMAGPAPVAPWIWQRDQTLLLLTAEGSAWMLAEFAFDERTCGYTEIRRAAYRWAGEAMGATLSRTLVAGDDAAVDAASELGAWFDSQRPIA